MRRFSFAVCLLALVGFPTVLCGASLPQANLEKEIVDEGGSVVRGADGNIVEVSLARTAAADEDVQHLMQIRTLKKLDLSFSYVTDAGIEELSKLPALEDLNLDTVEALTDATASYLHADKGLRRLVLRGTDITDVGMPYLAVLTGLKCLDLSYTMIGDAGLESLPALTELEELDLGGTRITGINLNFLKLLPKLKKLSFDGIQRRNGIACWTPLLTDLDLDTISLLAGLEDLDMGVGVRLGRTGVPVGPGNCHMTGGIQLNDLGVAKMAKLTKLKSLNISGSKVTTVGLKSLERLPQLESLSLWNCAKLDDSAGVELAMFTHLKDLDLSQTPVGDATLKMLEGIPGLKLLYLTDTKVTPEAVEAFRKGKPGTLVSWARRPEPPSAKPGNATKSSAGQEGER